MGWIKNASCAHCFQQISKKARFVKGLVFFVPAFYTVTYFIPDPLKRMSYYIMNPLCFTAAIHPWKG